ncbi:acylneuraminate cytidylyltransferase family protein [Tessaracoccus palaemonis]|uniref:Acylneuraminate cytidylyltransferase family protein n=1 Tax=Tessaracoccus palaemonis TaxID=2829499 RepID=A0ABX8SP24_9ACTN|nr:acylneuraminate cytidylyltransferase family protein [Tessaracoccus palaemonis]QXT62954.1 acylneuraminate cytidylyltransferase family protein [Tessaracoccus palaemonis]
MKEILALIPARGGSKGIPRKNLRDLGGKPLIVWTIQQALATPGLRVVVSTEDGEIAEVSRAAGAEVFLRPAELAQDTTATEPVVLHAISVATDEGRRPGAVVLLQATSPVRLPGTIGRALEQFNRTDVDSLVGVVPVPPFIWSTEDDRAVPHWDYEHRLRRQDMTERELRYRETGSLYVTRTEVYEQTRNRLGGRIGAFVMEPVEGTDIDSWDDLELAAARIPLV